MKRFFIILCATIMAMGTGTASAQEADTNLLQNGGFEDYSCNFLGCSWEDWKKTTRSKATQPYV